MPVVFIALIAIFATMVAVFAAGRGRATARTKALLMMSSGLGLVVFGVVTMLVTDSDAIVSVGAVGVVFIALGARRLRNASS